MKFLNTISKIFTTSDSTKQSYNNSKDSFIAVGASAMHLASDTTSAAIAVKDSAALVGYGTMAGVGLVTIGGVAAAASFAVPGAIGAALYGIGWTTASHYSTTIAVTNAATLAVNYKTPLKVVESSFHAVVDAVKIPYHATHGVFNGTLAIAKTAADYSNNALIAARLPNQEAVVSDDSDITIIEEKEMDSFFAESNIEQANLNNSDNISKVDDAIDVALSGVVEAA